jgi:NADH dehydrogenase/NADH:ubiquinone oxidoreductase subunit G
LGIHQEATNMPEHTSTPELDGAGTAPAENDEAAGRASLPDDVEARTFTQEDVDRIVTERLRRERQRTEKAVRDEFEGRIAELETAGEEARQARNETATLSSALKSAEARALVAERLLAKGAKLPPPYLGLIHGDDAEAVASIDAAQEQWAADMRRFAQPRADIGAPIRTATGQGARPTRVDDALAERMRRGEADAFREYRAIRR